MDYRKEIDDVLNLLGLTDKFPQKLTLCDAVCIKPDILGLDECQDPKKLYLHILQMIMAYHHRCRANLLHAESQSTICSSAAQSASLDDFYGEENEESAINVHPMDSLLALLHCADDFLRQDLMTRLVTCQISIPLLLPNPFTGELTLLLFAMKAIVKEWKSTIAGSDKICEGPIVMYTTPMIAFVRFSKQEKSKSKIMNEVISDSHNDYFFHRDCEGGDFKKVLDEGLVEISWYLPAGKANVFPDAVAFINLHGDARDHQKQIKFLSKMCFMTFVLFSDKDLDEKCTSVLKTLTEMPGGIVLLVCTEITAHEKFSEFRNVIPQGKLEGIKMMKKNMDVIRKEIRLRINKKLNELWKDLKTKPTLENGKEIANTCGIKVDENRPEVIEGHKMASRLYSMITEKGLEAKEKMLPLQSEELWKAWAKLDKEEHRPVNREGKTIEDYMTEKSNSKKKIRKLQTEHVKNLKTSTTPTLMEHFITSLSVSDATIRDYFLQYLKHFLNDLSRSNMRKFQQLYKEKRNELITYEENGNDVAIKECRNEIDILQKNMVKASLGLEHLLRELAQIYEATWRSPVFPNLPSIAAQLLIDGYPLELMDGDASHVPIKWIEGVMAEVVTKLGDSKVFVVSVLGLQSTGKSTLMNTAFGLQFNVSAGRCTRGAFMQLLPLTNGLNCEYVLIVDTEGLRAPEYDSQHVQKHDNELATFVIGLANVTMINIYGEVPGDIDDILQTAVHAFLRMKNVIEKLNPGCQFVHQNVSAVTASNRGEIGRSRFKDKLDKMTRAAAKEEECENKFKAFSDVIKFNSSKDVHHFPGLWNGVPPMAPVNEGYSNKALLLKSHLVEMIKQSSGQQLRPERLSNIAKRIGDLWRGLLDENFIFSFKNTMEITVYNDLDDHFIQWTRDLKSKMFEWQDKKEGDIKKIKSAPELESFRQNMVGVDLPQYVCSISDEVEKKMKDFFEQSEEQHILVQWKEETNGRLQRLKDKLQVKAEEHLSEVIKSLQVQNEVNDRRSIYCGRVADKVKALVRKLDKDEIKRKAAQKSEEDNYIEQKFEEAWKVWIEDIKRETKVTKVEEKIDVVHQVQETLTDYFRNERGKIFGMFRTKPLKQWGKNLKDDVAPSDEHFKFKRGFLATVKDKFTGPPALTKLHFQAAESTAQKVFTKVQQFIESKKGKDFHSDFVVKLLDMVQKVIDNYSSGDAEFTFTRDYKILVSLSVCGYAVGKFEQMVREFRQKNDPILYLETDVKDDLFSNFKDQYHQTADEKVAACAICEVLPTSIEEKVKKSLSSAIYDDIKEKRVSHFKSKAALKKKILLDLGEDAQKKSCVDLDDYFCYISDPRTSLQQWIRRYTREYSIEDSRLKKIATEKLHYEVCHIKQQMTEISYSDSYDWLEALCSACSLDFDSIKFVNKGGKKHLNDIANFVKEVEDGIYELERSLQATFEQMTVDDVDQMYGLPYDRLYDELLGCCAKCPFCHEQCDYSDEKHSSDHVCHVHRPRCLASYRKTQNQEMVIQVCNAAVVPSSELTYKNDDTNWNPKYYRHYRQTYPRWKIRAKNGAEVCGYWKWFMGEYYPQIANKIGAKANEIPDGWKHMQWHEAVESLKEDFSDIYML